MAGLLARWFAPEMNRLQVENDTLKARIDDLTDEKEDWKGLYVNEIKTNRTREDLLLNAALEAAGASPVLTREALVPDPPDPEKDKARDEYEESILRSRAFEIAIQRYNVDEPTDEQTEAVYRELLKNRQYWLNDN